MITAPNIPLDSDKPVLGINLRSQCRLESLYAYVKYEHVNGSKYQEIVGAGDIKGYNVEPGTVIKIEIFKAGVTGVNPLRENVIHTLEELELLAKI